MISESVARRYIKALFSVAGESGQGDVLGQLLPPLQELYRGHEGLRAVLNNPRLTDAKKHDVVLKLLGVPAPELLRRFLDLLLQKRRIGVLAHAGSIFTELQDEAAGVRHAAVVAALPMSETQEQRLAEVLSKHLGCRVITEVRVDPAVIGGVAVQVGDLLIDGTIRRRLEELRERFSGAQRVASG